MGRLKYIFHCILHMDYKSLFDTVKTVHEVSGKNRIWLFFDIIKCGFKYGAGYKDYLLCAFYDLSDKQRATYVTRGINNSIVKSLNDPAYYHIFDNKSEFYTTFAEYLHREWLHFSKCTKEQFLDFMQDKDEIICKPDDASCGVGVEKLKKADYATLDAMYEDLKKKGADVIEEVVIQHPDMNRINPDPSTPSACTRCFPTVCRTWCTRASAWATATARWITSMPAACIRRSTSRPAKSRARRATSSASSMSATRVRGACSRATRFRTGTR